MQSLLCLSYIRLYKLFSFFFTSILLLPFYSHSYSLKHERILRSSFFNKDFILFLKRNKTALRRSFDDTNVGEDVLFDGTSQDMGMIMIERVLLFDI